MRSETRRAALAGLVGLASCATKDLEPATAAHAPDASGAIGVSEDASSTSATGDEGTGATIADDSGRSSSPPATATPVAPPDASAAVAGDSARPLVRLQTRARVRLRQRRRHDRALEGHWLVVQLGGVARRHPLEGLHERGRVRADDLGRQFRRDDAREAGPGGREVLAHVQRAQLRIAVEPDAEPGRRSLAADPGLRQRPGR